MNRRMRLGCTLMCCWKYPVYNMQINRPFTRRSVLILGILCSLVLILLRFGHLGADPPGDLTRSGVFYTDEGWYSRNAVSHYLGGPWIVEDDFNPIVNMPGLQFINYLSFRFLGMGLASARFPGALAFALMLMLLFMALKPVLKNVAAAAAVLILAADYMLFVFARVAIAENIMMFFITACLLFSLRSPCVRPVFNSASAGLCLGLAVLTKLIAVFFLPVMVFLLWGAAFSGGMQSREDPVKRTGTALGAALLVLGLYFVLMVRPHMEDFTYFNTLNIAGRLKNTHGDGILKKAFYVLKGSSLRQNPAGMAFYVGGMIALLYSMMFRRCRRNTLMAAMALWTACYLSITAVNGYAPPRYYIPVMIPLAVALINVVFVIPRSAHFRKYTLIAAAAFAVLMGSIFSLNVRSIIQYISSPGYTFRDMSKSVGSIMRAGEENNGPVLLGHFANSIALEAGVRSINDTFKTADIGQVLDRYRPRYYVCYGPVDQMNRRNESRGSAFYIMHRYTLQFLASYDVLDNYYKGKPIYLYRLDER